MNMNKMAKNKFNKKKYQINIKIIKYKRIIFLIKFSINFQRLLKIINQ